MSAPRDIHLIRTLTHVYTIDLVFRAHLEGREHGFTTRTPDIQIFGEEIVDFQFIGGGLGSMSRSDILLHIANHTTYHRGHNAAMMYQIPAKPPTTDLPVFLRDTALQTERGPRGPL